MESLRNTEAIANTPKTLLGQAATSLRNSDWVLAERYLRECLRLCNGNSMAYLGMLLVKLHCRNEKELEYIYTSFEDEKYYKLALEHADKKYRRYLANLNIANIYHRAVTLMHDARTEEDFRAAGKLFASVGDYCNAKAFESDCKHKAQQAKNDRIYRTGMMAMRQNYYDEAYRCLSQVCFYKDAKEQLSILKKKKILRNLSLMPILLSLIMIVILVSTGYVVLAVAFMMLLLILTPMLIMLGV